MPIHGSAVDFSTIADTICRVVSMIRRPTESSPPNGEMRRFASTSTISGRALSCCGCTFSQSRNPVILSVARYSRVRRPPTLLAALRDPASTNVEIRQGSCHQQQGHRVALLQRRRRLVSARTLSCRARTRTPLGSPGRKPDHLVLDACAWAGTLPGNRALLHAGRSLRFSGKLTAWFPSQDPAPVLES